jgi:hypothetical protein
VLGLKIDLRSRTLWTTSNTENLRHYSLPSGQLIRSYPLLGAHLLNDLVVSSSGQVFVTDTKGGAVYKLSRDAQPFSRNTFKSPRFDAKIEASEPGLRPRLPRNFIDCGGVCLTVLQKEDNSQARSILNASSEIDGFIPRRRAPRIEQDSREIGLNPLGVFANNAWRSGQCEEQSAATLGSASRDAQLSNPSRRRPL